MESSTLRQCPDCGEIKPLSDYHRNRSSTTGHQGYCKPCWRIRSAQGVLARAARREGDPNRVLPLKKTCYKCSMVKASSEFPKNRAMRDGLASWCKECWNAYYAEREGNPEGRMRQRGRHLQRRYGLTIEEYDSLLASQGGKCAICGAVRAEDQRFFAVDHCHATGEVRGILCTTCNVTLGRIENAGGLPAFENYLGQESSC